MWEKGKEGGGERAEGRRAGLREGRSEAAPDLAAFPRGLCAEHGGHCLGGETEDPSRKQQDPGSLSRQPLSTGTEMAGAKKDS